MHCVIDRLYLVSQAKQFGYINKIFDEEFFREIDDLLENKRF